MRDFITIAELPRKPEKALKGREKNGVAESQMESGGKQRPVLL